MELIDFNNWIQILESTDPNSLIVKIDDDFEEIVIEEYKKALEDILSEYLQPDEYEIDYQKNNDTAVSIRYEEDEFSEAMFGKREVFKLRVVNPVTSINYYDSSPRLSKRSIVELIKRAGFENRMYANQDGGILTIRIRNAQYSPWPDQVAKDFARRLSTRYGYRGSLPGINAHDEWKISEDDFRQALEGNEQVISKLEQKFNFNVLYKTAVGALNRVTSTFTPDNEKILAELESGLRVIRSADPKEDSKMPEILMFVKRLLTLSDPRRKEESDLSAETLSETLKFLLNKFGSVSELRKQLKSIK